MIDTSDRALAVAAAPSHGDYRDNRTPFIFNERLNLLRDFCPRAETHSVREIEQCKQAKLPRVKLALNLHSKPNFKFWGPPRTNFAL